MEEFPGGLVEILRRVSILGNRHVAMLAKGMGVSMAEVAATHHLYGTGGMTPGSLGKLMYLTPGAVTQMADKLERAGYVRRVPNPGDRRSTLLQLTPEGEREALRRMEPMLRKAESVVEKLSPEERDIVAGFLEDVIIAMEPEAPE